MIKFQPEGLEKHSRPDFHSSPIVLESYNEEQRLDPVYYVKAYIKKTKAIRKSQQLFLTTVSPYGPASKQTLSRWLSQVIAMSGQAGTGGSVRSASYSFAIY